MSGMSDRVRAMPMQIAVNIPVFLEVARAAGSRLVRSRMVWCLLAIDAMFLVLHLVITGVAIMDEAPASANWARIDRDNSISEIYEYVKFTIASGLIISLSIFRKRPNLVPLSIIMAILVLDNMLGFHEYLGPIIVPGHQNYGELLYSLLLAALCMALTWAGFRNANKVERQQIITVWAGILVLGGFGVGVDAVHAKLVSWEILWADRWMGLVEDFGELVTITLILSVCLSFVRNEFRSAVKASILKPA